MKRRRPQYFLLFLTLLLLLLQLGADATSTGWYCMRNKAHRQPIFGEDLSFVEKYNGVYIDRMHGDENPEMWYILPLMRDMRTETWKKHWIF